MSLILAVQVRSSLRQSEHMMTLRLFRPDGR